MIGKTLAHYEVVELLGSGGMGEVYLARDVRLERQVAVKVIGPGAISDPHARARLLREARTASALNHPNICTVFDVGETDESAYVVMEYIQGRPLDTVIPPGGLPASEVRDYGVQICDALAHAHDRGIIHRDLKTANVILTGEGRIKLLDFGIARRLPAPSGGATRTLDTLTGAGTISGTIAYMAPETLRGETANVRTDIWGVGVMLFEMATGARPFDGQTAFALSSAILRDDPPPLSEDLPGGLRAIILRCIDKNPVGRHASAAELRSALESEDAGPTPAGHAAVSTASRREDIRSLAVLPLVNLSGDPAQEYFADGMTEAIMTTLAKIDDLRVISRTSAMQYKRSAKPLPDIARELGVDAVVEGSILRAGERIRITAHLIQAATDARLWGESYDGTMADVLDLQSRVSRAVAEEIRGQLSPGEKVSLSARAKPIDPAAYEAYLQGRNCWQQRSRKAILDAIEFYRRAIDLEPTYALAYAGIAECYSVLGFQGGLAPRESFVPAAVAAQRALDIDPNLAEAHFSLAYASLHYDRNWKKIAADFRRGLDLGPNYATGHHWYALYLASLGRRDEAVAEMRKAWEVDPLAPIIRTALGFVHYLFGGFGDAIREYGKVIDVAPAFWVARLMLGDAEAMGGRTAEGLEHLRETLDLSGRNPMALGAYGHALALARRKPEARKILSELQARAREGYVRPYEMARVHTGLGEREAALGYLEQALAEGGNWLNYIRANPVWTALHGDPTFEQLVERVYAGA